MNLRLYDTLTRRKHDFVPLDWERGVRMYVCGPTVYDFAHIGNARPLIVFDVLFRLLRHVYGAERVLFVRNITDVEDKINARAAELGIPIRELTERTYDEFRRDVAALGCLQPTVEPRATEHIEEMLELIERLIAAGHAYVADDHVLFDVDSMPDYGALSKRALDEMIAGARVEIAPYKRNATDFVLWKPSKSGEPAWDSPAGIMAPGRPGWHIECSAMAWRHLGETIDIHGGGIDLVFPHHENEIAQSRCAFHTPMLARFWMHNGFLQVEGEKMAKSAGNFITIRELLDEWPGDVLRAQMLMTHYRQPMDWTNSQSELVRSELEDWSSLLAGGYGYAKNEPSPEVLEALADDLNTPEASAVLRRLFHQAKKGDSEAVLKLAQNCKFFGLRKLGEPGLYRTGVRARNARTASISDHRKSIVRLRAALANDAPVSVRSKIEESLRKENLVVEYDRMGNVTLVGEDWVFGEKVQQLVDARTRARRARDFAEADRIRAELRTMGIAVTDSKDGTSWELAQ
jgi:cysteinyl-tRNA synthetase